MEKIYFHIKNLSAVLCLLCLQAKAQTLAPCAGVPASNTVIVLPNPVCAASSLTLGLLNSYSVSGIGYQWQSSTVSAVGPFSSIPGATLSTYFTPTLTFNNYYYQVVITCTNGGLSIIASGGTITISPSPVITIFTPTSSVCSGNSLTLIASGANTYTWSNGTIGNLNTVSPLSNTTYSAIGSNNVGCKGTASIAISVNPKPIVVAATSSNVICSGQITTLTAAGAASYLWINNGQTGSQNVVSPTITTNYSVVGTNTFGCIGNASVNVTVNPKPNVMISASRNIICTGETTTLMSSGATSYQWQGGTNPTSGSVVTTFPNQNPSYTVTGTDNLGCVNSTVLSLTVSLCTKTGASATNNFELTASPNPTYGDFEIRTNSALDKTIKLYDINGQTVLSLKSIKETTKIEITDLPNGVYYLTVSSSAGSSNSKIIKQ